MHLILQPAYTVSEMIELAEKSDGKLTINLLSGLTGTIPETFCEMEISRKVIIDCDMFTLCSCCYFDRSMMGHIEIECAQEWLGEDPEGLDF